MVFTSIKTSTSPLGGHWQMLSHRSYPTEAPTVAAANGGLTLTIWQSMTGSLARIKL
jgi:hypothetical protein